jgi:adenylate cyclase
MSAAGPPSVPSESELAELLRTGGVADEEIAAAAEADLLPLLAVETQILHDLRYDIDEVAERTGLDVGRICNLWGALGFAAPNPGERIFNDTDVEQFAEVAALVDSGLADPEVVVQLTRVVGSSLARIAEAQAELVATRRQTGDIAVSDGSRWFGDTFAAVLGQVWRRHLQSAARARLSGRLGRDSATEVELTVGFADLVGFTALSQQLDPAALAAVVDRFEAVAYAIVGGHGGRVVKMIGDEVMFAIDDPVDAAHCALDLSESYHEADDLSDVRVGLAHGLVVERNGDVFGPAVNLASRITALAYPGSVVVDEDLRHRLEPDDDFAFRTMLPRRLKHIGLVRLHSLRSSQRGLERRDDRQERRRARVAELTAGVPIAGSDDDTGS